MTRTCRECGQEFSFGADRYRVCSECRSGDYDDRAERAKSRARQLIAALQANRDAP
jgi:hypothetical protein